MLCRLIVLMPLVAMLGMAQAQIVLESTNGSEQPVKIWTVSDLNSTPPSVSTANGTAAGTLTGAGDFTGSEQFTLTASARYGWDTANARAATNSFGAYLSGLTVAGIGALNGPPAVFGVDSSAAATDENNTAFTGTSELLILTADTSGLSVGAGLSLKSLVFNIYDIAAFTDFLVYDVSANAVVEAQWNQHYSAEAVIGDWTLDDGDMVLIATGTDNTSTKWRITSVTLDAIASTVTDTNAPTPNPAEWDSLPTATGPFAITMTATTGIDVSGVEYFFAETSGNSGGSDSGWQISSLYTDTGLSPATNYSYAVMMRDTVGNSGPVSSVESATTAMALQGRTNGPPNVVIFFSDDLGYADISHNASPGSLVQTPHIDRICNEGIYLDNYMTHHVCSPSRGGLLTGRHYTEVGVGAQTGGTLDNSIPNIAKDFKAAGYATGAFGKWHSSFPPETDDGNWEEVPNIAGIDPYDGILQLTSDDTNFGEGVNAYGFDEWSGFYGGGHSYHDRIDAREFDWWINSTWSPDVSGYNTYIIRDSALKFIDNHADEPFFLYIPNECVHAPYEILNTDLEEMCNIVDDTNPTLAWSIVKELVSPTSGKKVEEVLQMYCSGGEEFDKDAIDLIHPGFSKLVYYTMIHAMDKSTGEIIDRLDVYGLTTNTIVVFTSDNGGTLSGDNYPFRGNKHQLYEGGVHVPAAILWPGHLDANQTPYTPADNVYTNIAQYFDWYPTLIDMTGQTLTATELDGLNLYSNLLTRTPVRTGYAGSYYGVDDQWAAIRTQRWKLHFNRVPGPNQMLELYDLSTEIAETNNVQAVYPAERDTLIAMMDEWFSSGNVSGSYYPLMGALIPPYLDPSPEGDILEVKASQTKSLSNPNNDGIYVRYSDPDWVPAVLPYDGYVHAGDIFQYDIYVAEDSDQINGIYCSPSTGPKPRYNSIRGIDLDGMLLVEQTLPKGRWMRRLCGMGEVAPNTSYASFIALHNSSPGYYHFYIDNVVIRKNDGSIRGVTWSDASDWTTTKFLKKGTAYNSLADVPDAAYSNITLNVADLSNLPAPTNTGSAYGSWMASIGGGIGGYDPTGSGPINDWAIIMEYGLGRDPTTYTAGLTRGTNAPTSEQLGTYSLQSDYMTMTFDFNREASDIKVVVAESSNLVDWVESVVLQPPYTDTSILATNEQVVDVQDNLSGYPVDTTRVTAQGKVALNDASEGFLKLEVRPVVAVPDTPENLTASVHNGIVLEWSGSNENGEYIIERSVSGSGSFLEIARTERQLYTDATAVLGSTYDYRVRAVNAAGVTSWSGTESMTR
ncbi:sulfatase-like hydrolase/transferase [Pontiella sulfatireligans]|uniref:Arylsulfatase n=1 Tax=Pontiella sulfatireligans TaxID=2750658 RepID=A0A6C2UWG4_9BACT|nr:sulfatase-like hydrolase/transferase [Pontiella sulfatireligans]SPS74584.1 sulfatase S1_N.C [Kiritimatiellales bacterium]VGO23534.1 Arylsulfatase [Pontiella sulfatireligans]